MERNNVDNIKGKNCKQGPTSAKDLAVILSERRYSPYNRSKITNQIYIIMYGP